MTDETRAKLDDLLLDLNPAEIRECIERCDSKAWAIVFRKMNRANKIIEKMIGHCTPLEIREELRINRERKD